MKSEAIEELERRLQTDWAGMPEWAKEGLRQWTVAIENLPLSLPKKTVFRFAWRVAELSQSPVRDIDATWESLRPVLQRLTTAQITAIALMHVLLISYLRLHAMDAGEAREEATLVIDAIAGALWDVPALAQQDWSNIRGEVHAIVEALKNMGNVLQSASLPASKPKRPRRRPDLPPVLKMPNDPVSRLIPIVLGKMREWTYLPPDYPDVPFGILLDGGREVQGKAAVGLSVADEVTLGIWREVGKHGAMAVKAHLLLWTYYLEARERRESLVALHMNDACRFLGIQPHPRGGYRARDRQKALETLNLVLRMAVDLGLSPRRKGKKEVKPYIRGALWDRYEAGTRYHDLFGEDPLLIVYRPSVLAEQLRENYQMIAQVGRPLLELHAKNDQWAILLGTYFATLDRVNRYKARPARVRVYTALERCGLLTDWYLNHPLQAEEKFHRAMNTLQERGVIELWTLNDTGLREVPPDDDSPLPPGAVDFFRRVVTVQFPVPARGKLPSDTRQ